MHTLDFERITAEKIGGLAWILDELERRLRDTNRLDGLAAARRLPARRARRSTSPLAARRRPARSRRVRERRLGDGAARRCASRAATRARGHRAARPRGTRRRSRLRLRSRVASAVSIAPRSDRRSPVVRPTSSRSSSRGEGSGCDEVRGRLRARAVRRVRAWGDRRVAGAARARARRLARRSRRRARRPRRRRPVGASSWAGDELLAARSRAASSSAAPPRRSASSTRRRSEPRSGSTGRARHGLGAASFAAPEPRGGLGLGPPSSEARPEITLDGSGTVLVDVSATGRLEDVAARACWRAWNAATLAYLAGLAEHALELAVDHARSREQFGAPLGALPAVQSRLADAALATGRVTLLAWSAATADEGLQRTALRFAGAACCRVTASAHQVHGAVGFALETGLHAYHRRARSVASWAAAVAARLTEESRPISVSAQSSHSRCVRIRAQTALERDAERLLLAAWSARARLDRLELREPRHASAVARARARRVPRRARAATGRTCAAPRRCARDGRARVSRSQRRISASAASVTAYVLEFRAPAPVCSISPSSRSRASSG